VILQSHRKSGAKRVALLTSIPAPYRVPVYRSLSHTPGWRLRVFASAESEFDRSWDVDTSDIDITYPRTLSFRRRVREEGSVPRTLTRHLPLGLFRSLCRFRPDVVISGELGPRTVVAWLYCTLMRVPLVVWSYHSRASGRAAGRMRSIWRRWLLGRARAVIGMGVQAREVLEGLGVPPARLFDAPNAHDVESCGKTLAGIDRELNHLSLGAGLGCRERIAVVVGRLVESKGIRPLLEAWSRLPSDLRRGWTLLFVGSGPLEATVRRAAARAPAGEIASVGAVAPQDVVEFYAGADVLVFPTLWEPWGLVVNEAQACGLPVICSKLAGCADDLVRPGENGWLVDPTDPAAMARTLAEALEEPDLESLGTAGRSSVRNFGAERMAEGMRGAVSLALAGR
jgi:glycosyltransferase involved in cell wall biosynthesis